MNKDGLFDVKMEVYDGAEVYQFLKAFLLDKISQKIIKVIISVHIVKTGCQYLKTKAAPTLKK